MDISLFEEDPDYGAEFKVLDNIMVKRSIKDEIISQDPSLVRPPDVIY